MPLYIAKSGDLDSQRKDSATQLLIKYKSGALVTQSLIFYISEKITSSSNLWLQTFQANIQNVLLWFNFIRMS